MKRMGEEFSLVEVCFDVFTRSSQFKTRNSGKVWQGEGFGGRLCTKAQTGRQSETRLLRVTLVIRVLFGAWSEEGEGRNLQQTGMFLWRQAAAWWSKRGTSKAGRLGTGIPVSHSGLEAGTTAVARAVPTEAKAQKKHLKQLWQRQTTE